MSTVRHAKQAVQRDTIAQITVWPEFRVPRTGSSHGLSDGYAEGGDAVQDGGPDGELRDLTVDVPHHEALTGRLDAMHLRLRPASVAMASWHLRVSRAPSAATLAT